MLNLKDFKALKESQYCDNPDCECYKLVGAGNIRTHSRPKGQVYCALCKNRWVVTKGTLHFGLKTPIDKVIQTIQLMAQGMGLRKASRQQGITPDAASSWIKKASKQEEDFKKYMQNEMDLEESEVEEFWKFVEKKAK